jgi:hypothetical protein
MNMKNLRQKFCMFGKCYLATAIITFVVFAEVGFGQTNNPLEIPQTNRPQINIQIPSTVLITNTISIKPDEGTLVLLRQAERDHTFKEAALLIVGALFAGLIGLVASLILHNLDVEHRRKEEREFRDNILRAIRCELESLGMIHEKGIGAKLKEFEKLDIFPIRLSLTQKWFTVFKANAVHLGKIEKKISNRIITTYAFNKALIEAFKINNDYLAEMTRIEFEILQREGELYLKKRREIVRERMVVQATLIKKLDGALKEAVKDLFAVLDERDIR